jgi:hypothetical protein
MVKGRILYVKACDAGTQPVNIFTSIQGQGLRTPKQRITDHSHAMGQDRARQGSLPNYLNNRRSQVRVGDKVALPYWPPHKLSSEAKPVPQGSDPETFSSIVHLITKNTLEQARTLWKPPIKLGEPTISSLDPLVM